MPITEGARDQDLRYDPILGAFVPEDITAELQTCSLLTGKGVRYGVKLYEIPFKESPSSVVVTRTSDSQVFSEVTSDPGPEEFYVDYHRTVLSNTGIIVLPSSEDGEEFEIAYRGLGSAQNVVSSEYIGEQIAAAILTVFRTFDTAETNLANDARVYRITASTPGAPDFDITGVPDIDGTILLIDNRFALANISIHGQSIATTSLSGFKLILAYRLSGTWRSNWVLSDGGV